MAYIKNLPSLKLFPQNFLEALVLKIRILIQNCGTGQKEIENDCQNSEHNSKNLPKSPNSDRPVFSHVNVRGKPSTMVSARRAGRDNQATTKTKTRKRNINIFNVSDITTHYIHSKFPKATSLTNSSNIHEHTPK